MCEVLDRVEQNGIAMDEQRGTLSKAKESTLNLRKMGFGFGLPRPLRLAM